MMVCSTISPPIVSLVKLENNIAIYKLRQNITEITAANVFQNVSDNLFSYEELELEITHVENIEQFIADNFATYWTLATEQEAKKKELADKEKQIRDLIGNDNYYLIAVNWQTQNMMNSLVDAMVSMSMNSLV